jgi:hypothetical protein
MQFGLGEVFFIFRGHVLGSVNGKTFPGNRQCVKLQSRHKSRFLLITVTGRHRWVADQSENRCEMKASEVLRLIHDAWRDVPYPGDDNIFTKDSYDDEDIVNYFGGTTWRNRDPAKLRAHSSAFTFFTPQAFHYWLPAFLIAAIENPEEADVICDYIPWSVCDVYAPERWPLFSPEQRQAVAVYFRFQIERFRDGVDGERRALGILGNST